MSMSGAWREMIDIWQDFDENSRSTWCMWFGTRSLDGHIVSIVGPFHSYDDAVQALGGL